MNNTNTFFFLIVLFLFQNSFASEFMYVNETDEFTDEPKLNFGILDDTASGGVMVTCNNKQFFLGANTESFFESKSSVDVKIRFDKDDVITKNLNVVGNRLVYASDRNFIMNILDRIKDSSVFILKIGTEKTLTFSGYEGVDVEIDKFLNDLRLIESCNS